jgi:putative ABC transport system permease protein
MQTLWRDLRFAARTLWKHPGFAATTILTLALGIGANSAIFALVDATLLRPLPFRDPDRLVMLWERTETSRRDRVAPLNLIDWNKRNSTFDGIAGFLPNVGGMVMNRPDGTPENVSRQWVTHGFFDVLGVKPVVGRTFLPSDDASRSNTVVLSEGFWRASFNADPGVVGREIRLDGASYKVAGVVPREF